MNERVDGNRLAIWTLVATTIAVLNFAAYVSTRNSKSTTEALFQWSYAVSGAVFLGILIAISLGISRGRSDLRAFRSPRIPGGEMVGIGVLAVVGVIVASLLVALLGGNPAREQGLVTEHWQAGRVAPFVASAVVITVITPIAEELFIRGLGFGLIRPFGRAAAIAVPALVWALMHGLPAGIFPLFVFGLGLGYLRDRSESTIPGMVLHGLYNGLSLALAFAG